MYKHFGKTEDIPAMLVVDGLDQGVCDVRIRYNPYDLNNMQAELFDPPTTLDIPDLPDQPTFADYDQLDARLVTEGYGRKHSVSINPTSLSNFQLRRIQGRHSVTVPVTECIWDRTWEREGDEDLEEEVSVTVLYRFPLTTAVRSHGGATRDSKYGYYLGERMSGEETIQVRDNSFFVETPASEAEFCESFDINEDTTNRIYPAVILVKRSVCLFRLTCQTAVLDQKIQQVRDHIDSLLRVLSFVEQNRINWAEENIEINSSSNSPIRHKRTYRWSSPPNDKYTPERSHHRQARKSFIKLWNAYRELDDEQRDCIDAVLKNCSSSSCAKILESKLISYHSCLDHMLDVLFKGDHDRGPFSRRVVKVCDAQGVDVSDLLERAVIEHYRSGKRGTQRFRFNKARNQLVHDGLTSMTGSSYDLINAIREVRAVTERLLMKALGVDHNEVYDIDRNRPGALSI